MNKGFGKRISNGVSLLLAAAVATAPIPAAGQDSVYMFRFSSGQVYGDLKATEIAIGDIYVGESFSHTLTVEGGKGNKTWISTGSALPGGLSLNSSGEISGTPRADAVGTWENLSFQARDELAQTIDVGPFSIRVLSPVAVSVAGGYAYVGESADFPVGASGGLPPYSYSLAAGSLPEGMSLSGDSVTGTPAAKGSFNATVRVTDANGRSAEAGIGIIARERLVASAALPDGYVGEAYAGSFMAEGGEPPYIWEVHPGHALPDGLFLGSATGAVSGTPLVPAVGHSFTTTVVDSTADQDETVTAEISVYDLPLITQGTLPRGTPGFPYSVMLDATGGKPSLNWDVAAGQLPAGLVLSEGGTLSGTPTVTGQFTPTFRITDANGRSDSESLTLNVVNDLVASLPVFLDTYTDEAFSFTATAGGGLAPYTWTAAPLPAGLSLTPAGVLSGTPSAAGSVNTIFTVEDSIGLTDAVPVAVRSYNPVAISAADADPLYAGLPVTGSGFAATGGKPPLAWSVSSGTLPSGVNLSASGVLSGTPSAAGGGTVTVQVADANGRFQTRPVDLTVLAPPAVAGTALPEPYVGTAYSHMFTATAGQSPYSWAVASGSVPAGLTLATNGTLSGTPTTAGTSTFTVRATDANDVTATRNVTLVTRGALAVASTAVPEPYVGTPYTFDFTASGGRTAYSWAVASGTVPSGLTLAANGRLSGTPTTAGNSTFTVRATDANGVAATRSVTLVTRGALTVASTAVPEPYDGTAYSFDFTATGGKTAYTWAVASGSVPAGLTLATDGTLSGTPTTPGTSTFTVRVVDANGKTATRDVTLATRNALAVAATTVPEPYDGTAYSFDFTATGGRTAYTWAVSSGSIPAGLTLATDGTLSGTPTTPGTSAFTVRVADANGVTATRSVILVTRGALAVAGTALPEPYDGTAYSFDFTATGGRTAYTWAFASGSVPAGLTLASSGRLSGTPTTPGTSTFTVRVADANGKTATRSVTLVTRSALAVVSTTVPEPYDGTAYSFDFSATGGRTAYTWALASGSVPAGLTLATDGTLSGTPTTPGTSTFTVRVADANGVTATRSVSLVTRGALAVAGTVVPEPYDGTAYSFDFTATGGKTAYTWAVASGSVPAGLTLASSGRLSGTPTTPGTSTFTVRVADANGKTATRSVTLVTRGTLAVANAAVPDPYVGTAYALDLSASGGKTPYTWSASNLPAGLGINASTGVISGTPSSTAAATATVTVRDANAVTASRSFAFTPRAALAVANASPGNRTAGYAAANYQFTATGGLAPYSWSRSGSFPAGMTLSSTGVLSGAPTTAGSYTFTVTVTDGNSVTASRAVSMTVTAPASCSAPWGGTVAHGSSVTAYAASSVPYGGSCAAQTRSCSNGVLSGSYGYDTCQPEPPANCTVTSFYGSTVVLHGQTRTFYDRTSASYCTMYDQSRTCTNGVMSGSSSYSFASCTSTGPR